MKGEGGGALPTGIRPTSDLEQLMGSEVVGALTQISREHASATGALVLTWGSGGDQLGREIVAEELRDLKLPAGARREEAARASDEEGAETGEGQPTARVEGRAEPNRICHEPPPRTRTPGYDSVVFLDEVTRVMRARHAFGVLGDVVVQATPSQGRVEQLYQQAVARLGHTDQKRKQAGRPPCTSEQMAEAGERLRKARVELLNDVFRGEEHARIRREGRPVKGVRAAAALTSNLAAPAGGMRGVTSRAGWEGRGEREEQRLDEAADALLQRVLRGAFHRHACVHCIRHSARRVTFVLVCRELCFCVLPPCHRS